MTDIVYNKNGIPFDIDALATDVNGKLDRDCLNYSATGASVMGSMAMPSDKYINLENDIPLTANVSYSYTAPTDGYLFFNARSTAGGQYLGCFGDTLYRHIEIWVPNSGYIIQPPILPMRKGQQIKDIRANFTPTEKVVRFIYAVGSEPEAN